MKKTNRPNRVLGAAAILLCLCLISAHFTMGLYARYTTRASGKDAARAAKFNVEAEVTEVVPENPPTGTNASLTRSYHAKLVNKSEVAVCASIKMVFDEGVIITSGKIGNTTINAEDNTIVFNGSSDIAPDAKRDEVPGMEKIVSRIIVPPSACENCVPRAVMTGIMAFFSTWR